MTDELGTGCWWKMYKIVMFSGIKDDKWQVSYILHQFKVMLQNCTKHRFSPKYKRADMAKSGKALLQVI